MGMFKRQQLALAVATAALGLPVNAIAEDTTSDEMVELQPITVVTAAGYEQNIADAPASISVITREQLEKQSYSDVTDAVRNIPGVFVTGGGNMQDISIRGMDDSYTLYLVDGRPISAGRMVNTNGADGGKQIGLPPISMIERIEVIRGPMSSLYGSEAMGGVINIITRRGGDEWAGSISTEYTGAMNDISSDSQQADFYLAGPIIQGLLGAQFTGTYVGTDESDYIGGGDSAASMPESTRKQGGAEFYLTPNEQNRFSLGYTASELKYTHTPGKSIAADADPSTYRYEKDVYVFSHDGNYGDLIINSFLQHDVSDKPGTGSTKQEEVSLLNTQASYFWGDHVVTFGGQYKQEEFVDETNGLLTSNIPGAVKSVDRWIAALYTEVDWALTDDLSVTTGLRYNDDELFGGELSPRLYGVYRLNPEWVIKGGVSTGYRQPTLSDATEGFGRGTGGGGSPAPHPRALIIGNPDLKPETSTNYEIGYVYDNAALGLNTSAMLFHTQYKDKIAEDRFCESPNGDRGDPATWTCGFGGNNYYFLSTRKNISEAVMQGVELTLDYRFQPNWNLSSSYTFTRSEQKSGEFKGEPLNRQPRHMLNGLLEWDVNARLNAWLQGNYRSKTSDYMGRTSMSDGTPGSGFVDIGAGYRLTDNVNVKAGLYNVANKEVTNDSYGVVLDGRRLTVGMTVDF
ncbi:TonB-dependent receptor domain-containing protein [Halopseudomonas aestusnigri]|uniref:Outer membrane receptor for ferrienterochelin and colicins n=1 Tax=Halopseudomonas aestusnigri TaxID=857252 RepID=A0AAQ1G891_9GAMM|nr:TonB-dependent receptor [Halopseudomonas aestusnigri]OWL88608.1 ligand-gated channel protein [Halopseudomonas aestusnigri]SEG39767.1 outer membrane receptor for ferrienterochelin and colicins [Halopseudomonas aestusnigri]